jgi:nitrogen fixation NifU-like protein
MNDIRELYQQLIIDHGRHPRNFGKLEQATHSHVGHNPLCGDQLTLYLKVNNGQVLDAKFEGRGCAISVASASLMTEMLKGLRIADAEQLFHDFHHLLTDRNQDPQLLDKLGKLAVLSGVGAYPARVKCATLAWHTMHAALGNEQKPVSTE